MSYQVGEIVQGTITRILSYGAMMVFEDETMGLLHISEVSNNYIRNIYRYLKVGAIYQVKVLSYDQENNFLKVTLKGLSEEERHLVEGLNNRNQARFDSKSLLTKLDSWINEALIKEK